LKALWQRRSGAERQSLLVVLLEKGIEGEEAALLSQWGSIAENCIAKGKEMRDLLGACRVACVA